MKLTPFVTALSLTLAPLPAQADLDGRDAAKILGGLAAIYLLNEALRREDGRAPAPQPQPRREARAPQPGQPGETYSHIHADGTGGGWHDHTVGVPHARQDHDGGPAVARADPGPAPLPAPAPLPDVTRGPLPADPLPELPRARDRGPVEVKLLPERCRADVSNAIETIEGYDAQCLQNAVVLPGSLPPQCIVRHPDRTIYEAVCLRRDGWSTRLARN